IGFWEKSAGAPRENQLVWLSGLMVHFLDEEKLSVMGRFVRGYSTGVGGVAVIGRRDNDAKYVWNLFKHEVSHVILNGFGMPLDEKVHHEKFAVLKLEDLPPQ
ncbi:hypothetical protein, partial [Candidatus Magnetobacterium casense]